MTSINEWGTVVNMGKFVSAMTDQDAADWLWRNGGQASDCLNQVQVAHFRSLQREWDRARRWDDIWSDEPQADDGLPVFESSIEDDYDWIRHGC